MHRRTPPYATFLITMSVALLCAFSAFSQTAVPADSSKTKHEEPLVVKPTVGFSLGMLSFIGDHNGSHVSDPQYGRLGYQLSLAQRLSPSLLFSMNFLYGSLAATEHSGSTYLNFESQIRAGSIELEYNFDNFFKLKTRKMSPYVSLGFESFEFLSKSDMFDAYGNKYFYWNDGSIRNIDPDYTYETDLRTLNKSDYGKYSEFSFAIPVGAGMLFHLSPRLDFKIGTTLHFTFTDYIDGLPASQVGPGKHYDKFLMSSFMLRYDLFNPDEASATKDSHRFDDVDFAALDMEDSDNDGVPDVRDSCQGTPAGVVVDVKGCPVDTDGDGVPDYLDKEPNTPAKSIVDVNGVAMSDSLIAESWDRFNDSTGKYALHEVLPPGGHMGFHAPRRDKKEYTVLLGAFKKGLSTEKMTKFLSIEDIRSTNLDDSTTVYTAGRFGDVLSAEKRKKQLVADGMPEAKVVYLKNGKFVEPEPVFENNPGKEGNGTVKGGKETVSGKGTKGTKEGGKETTSGKGTKGTKEGGKETSSGKGNNGTKGGHKEENSTETGSNTNTPPSSSAVVFRVQLGAFKHRISTATFDDAGNVLEFKGEDGLYKYLAGSFSNFNDAAKYKVEILSKGYEGAFIAAYKNGKRIPLTAVGAIPAGKAQVDSENVKAAAVKKDLVVFKVQIGVFKSDPPAELKAKFNTLKNVEQSTTTTGLTRYTTGSFHDYSSAQRFKEELHKQGIDGAFVIAFFKDELISVPEAIELLRQ
jgi:hypothetical protein